MTSMERNELLNRGFTAEQIEEIQVGMESGIDVSLYADKKFLPIQMRQIRLGLEEALSVNVYAKPEYDWFQMEEIRKGLRAGVDVSIYASPDISYEKMRQLRKAMLEGVQLTDYIHLKANVLRELRKSKRTGVDILEYINQGYDAEQLCEIRGALENGIDLAPYLMKEYRAASIAEIREGLEKGVDVSIYAMIQYSWRQMREIRKGLENRIQVEKYLSRLYSWEQMREIRLGLEQGLDVEGYRLLRYTAGEMRKKRKLILEGINQERDRVLQNQIKSEDFMFEFTSNDMEVYVTALTKKKVITRDRFMKILGEKDICKGILEKSVEEIVSGKNSGKAILIAKGEIPRKGEDGWYEYLFRTNPDKKPKVLEDGSVDYRNMDWFEMVKAGQIVAVYHEATEGMDGYNVKGEVIKARKGIEKSILLGKGFQLTSDRKTYIATMDGKITLEDNEMVITNHLVLDEVTMATGNIVFDGSIHIRGDVKYDSVVKATGDIVVEGNVEAAVLESDGSIVLKKGMNSSGRGQIKAGKNVVSRFFEAANIYAQGNIEVDKSLNSQLFAEDMIICSNVIVGGTAQAKGGLQMKHVGNQAGLSTILKVTIDEKVRKEHKVIKDKIRDVSAELQMLVKSYEEFKVKLPPEVRVNMEIFTKLEKAVYTKRKQLEQLKNVNDEMEQKIDKVRNAKITVSGQAHEGVVVEMEGSKWAADDRYNIVITKRDGEIEVMTNWM